MANKTLFQSLVGPILPQSTTRNEAGGPAFAFEPKHALAQYAMTGCLNATFYASAETQLEKTLELAAKVEAEFVAKTAIHCRTEGYMKDMPALLCASLAARDTALLGRVFDRVIDDGKMLRNLVQILRTSLALSLITGQPFRMMNIRAGRKKPGLLRQHLTAVRAATEIGDAVSDGAEPGSREIVFRPETVRAGEYHFAIGTAGSTTLVLQTILPALMLAGTPSRVVLEGGTHNPFAPPHDFLAHTFVPQLARFGPRVEITLVRPGFAPAGGGRLEIAITPVEKLAPIDLCERGTDQGRRVVAHLAAIDSRVAERAFQQVARRMQWEADCFETVNHGTNCGPGFLLSGHVASAEITETFTGFGERGVRSEAVADAVVDQVRDYLASTAPVGEYLADQLMLPLALAGSGAFRAIRLSRHARTNMDVIRQFLPVDFQIVDMEADGVKVQIG